MKHFSIYLKISIIFLLIYSCSKQNDWKTYDETSNFFIESILGVTFDQDIEELVDDAFYSKSNTSKTPKKRFKDDKYGTCATISVDEENNIKTITFDGECVGKRGQIRSGIIIVTYSDTKGEIGSFRQINFDDFYLNDIKIEGVRRNEVVDIDQTLNKTVQMTLENGKMIYPDESFSIKSKVITKFIVFEDEKHFSTTITGNVNSIDSNGELYYMEITVPILFTRECSEELNNRKGRIPVAGEKIIIKGEDEIIVNFGDGECDFMAEVTKNGQTEIIDLRKIRRKKKFPKN
ncbi:MAG: hypothetical protein CMC79_02485 [Flavobacteriaceae bacterium]|nr:hypothetical protein [Flavobacteriaceae bacterium]|tara:strand:- start:51248 stop:52120 length:873 start_codon:yes stop_codon:yes gene_type:complete